MRPRGKQDATRPARERRLAVAAVLALLAVAPAASAQDAAVPAVDPAPQPDPAAQPDPARTSPAPAPATVESAPAPSAVESDPAASAPAPEATAAPAAAAAVESDRAPRAERRRHVAPRPRETVTPARVGGDRSWERAPAPAIRLAGGDDDRIRQAAAGLLALCLASAALQLLTMRLRRGALP